MFTTIFMDFKTEESSLEQAYHLDVIKAKLIHELPYQIGVIDSNALLSTVQGKDSKYYWRIKLMFPFSDQYSINKIAQSAFNIGAAVGNLFPNETISLVISGE